VIGVGVGVFRPAVADGPVRTVANCIRVRGKSDLTGCAAPFPDLMHPAFGSPRRSTTVLRLPGILAHRAAGLKALRPPRFRVCWTPRHDPGVAFEISIPGGCCRYWSCHRLDKLRSRPELLLTTRQPLATLGCAKVVLCDRQKFGLSHSLEKGVRYRKCKAPFGPFRFSVPDPVFPADPES
jgi:hypothetical protein